MNLTWKIGGEAGFGIMTTGVAFSRLCTRHGYYIYDYIEYPSLIRGGHNVYEVRVSDTPVFSQEKQTDILICLNQETFTKHIDELKLNGLVIYDQDSFTIDQTKFKGKNITFYHLSFTQLVNDNKLSALMINNVALGASCAILGMDINILDSLISDTFTDKGAEIITANITAAKLGYDYCLKNPITNVVQKLPKRQENITKQIVLTGNEATALGAIASGCKFFAAYPMTPTSNVLHAMADWGEKCGVVVKHAEDEISVVNMVIGASYAGVRSMTATAGGGFSLMVEGLGLAGITETPIVINVGQRPGPATGMPTWTGQGDLLFLLNASQDEFPRIIIAPGDVKEMFEMTSQAFNIADNLQTPVILITDKYLAEGHQSFPEFDLSQIKINRGKYIPLTQIVENYQRYQLVEDGISPRSLPGSKNIFMANSYEHDESGLTTELSDMRIKQQTKRMTKLNTFIQQMPQPNIYGDENADIILICWGSTKGPALEALKLLKQDNISCKMIHTSFIWPFPKEFMTEKLKSSKKLVLIEGNSQGQFGLLLKSQTGIDIEHKILKYDGRPFYPEEIVEKIKDLRLMIKE